MWKKKTMISISQKVEYAVTVTIVWHLTPGDVLPPMELISSLPRREAPLAIRPTWYLYLIGMVLFTISAARKSSVLKVRHFLNITLTQGPVGKKETAWHIIIPFVALTAINFNFIFIQIFIPYIRYFPVMRQARIWSRIHYFNVFAKKKSLFTLWRGDVKSSPHHKKYVDAIQNICASS